MIKKLREHEIRFIMDADEIRRKAMALARDMHPRNVAEALGVGRSTVYDVLAGKHKSHRQVINDLQKKKDRTHPPA
jgi:hypothetical protein